MRRGSKGLTTGTLVLALATSISTARGADPTLGVENLRVGFASNTQNNLFKIGTWTPIWVQLRGGAERFTGTLEIQVPDDDGTPTRFRQPVEIAPRETPRVVSYARPGTRDPEFTIRLLDGRNREVARATSETLPQFQADPVLPDEILLLTLGNPQGVELIGGLPGFSGDQNTGGQPVRIARLNPNLGQVPGRWYGYDSAEAVVIDTNDRDVMADLALRGQALADWVNHGGHLVLSVGGNWQALRDSVLAPILPALPNGQERLTTLEALDSYAVATKPILPAGSGAVMATKLDEVEARGGKVLAQTGSVPLVVRGAYGFGRVTLVALDVDQKPFADWADRALFWVKAIDLRARPGENANATQFRGGGRALYRTGVSDLATQLRAALEQFPGVKLVPFGWVAFFIFLYILLIGPGDYFFLKKVVKRMEMTWVTFPVIVASVSLAAYVAAYAFKGQELRINKVDVLDVDQVRGQARGQARGSSFFNLFSPQNRDYDVAVVPQGIDQPVSKPAETSQENPPERPPAGTEVQVSWLGVPEPGFGGMGGTGRVGFAGRGYLYEPQGNPERIEGLRIPIWSTKCLTARWFGPGPKIVTSDLQPVGTDRLSGTVTNDLDEPMSDALLAFGRQIYQLGTIAPGQTVRVELTQDRQFSPFLRSRANQYAPGRAAAQRDAISRADLLVAMMFHDTQTGTAGDRPLASEPLGYLDLTGQLALDRPMLVARIDRPVAKLVLGN
ncbi:MAG: hypothetical protein AB7I30_15085, partial [Isosphaeraceae bacterium]